MRNVFVPILITFGLLAAGSAAAARPNIVFILTDDMALHDASFMPKLQSLVATPDVPRVAHEQHDVRRIPNRRA